MTRDPAYESETPLESAEDWKATHANPYETSAQMYPDDPALGLVHASMAEFLAFEAAMCQCDGDVCNGTCDPEVEA